MLGYLSESTFVWKLIYDIIMWIVILSIVFYCIKRNPTDYDTNYRKRYRTIMGVLCILGAIGLMFINLKNLLLPNYYLSTFGTFTPNETMLQYGMGPNVPMREAGVDAVFALPTFEQWLVLSKIKNFSILAACGLMFLFYKKSATRTAAKIRKAFGYFFLLFLVPAALDSHYFFDWEEFLFTGIAVLIVWLLLRTYSKDAIAPTLPEESKLHSENKDFMAIKPEKEIVITQPQADVSKESQKNEKLPRKQCKNRNGNSKVLILLLSVFANLFLLLSVVFISFYHYSEEQCSRYEYNTTYDLWILRNYSSPWKMQEYKYVDYQLGKPIVEDYSLCLTRYGTREEGRSWYYVGWTSNTSHPQYYRLLSYNIDDSTNYISSQMKRLQAEGYSFEISFVRKYNKEYQQLIFYDSIDDAFKYMHNSVMKETNCWYRKHIVEVRRGKAYEFIAYVPDLNIYDDCYESDYLLDSPKNVWNVEMWRGLSWLCMGCTILFAITLLIYTICNRQKLQIENKHAFSALIYQSICVILEYPLYVIYALFDCSGELLPYEVTIVYAIFLFSFRLPLIIYTFRKIKCESGSYSLFPQWLENTINHFATSEAPMRAMLVFIIFPLFYICTLPCGIFALLYLIPAIVLYILVFFIIWIIKGIAIPVDKNKSNP